MPNYFMPAKDPEEVRNFFSALQDQGKIKVTLANERPDVYNYITPTEEVRLVVDVAGSHPPENVSFDRVLEEFRPSPLPEDQLASWSDEVPDPTAVETEPEGDAVTDVPPTPAEEMAPESTPEASAATVVKSGGGILDQKWKPFTERGFKG